MNIREFYERMEAGEVELRDIPIVAAIILSALIVVIGEIGCAIGFFGILFYGLFFNTAKLLLLIPCIVMFSILTAIIFYVYTNYLDT